MTAFLDHLRGTCVDEGSDDELYRQRQELDKHIMGINSWTGSIWLILLLKQFKQTDARREGRSRRCRFSWLPDPWILNKMLQNVIVDGLIGIQDIKLCYTLQYCPQCSRVQYVAINAAFNR